MAPEAGAAASPTSPQPSPPPRAEREKSADLLLNGGRGGAGWLASLAVYREPRLIAVLLMGFASGLPLALTFGTLSFWLSEVGVSRTSIGLFALVGISYSLKFLWSPAIDRLPIPILTARLGRRRGWALAIQPALALAILALGFTDPRSDPGVTALAAVVVAFLSASQDIVIDAYRIELLRPEEQGAGAAATQWGYRFGMLAASAGALYAASFGGWSFAYGLMAGLMFVGMAAVWFTPEPGGIRPLDPLPGDSPFTRVAAWLERAVVAPFADMLGRRGALAILSFVILYKFGDALAGTMSNPLYVSLGFTKVEVANIGKAYGFRRQSRRSRRRGRRRAAARHSPRAARLRRAADAVEPDVCAASLGRARRADPGADHRRRKPDRRHGVGGVRCLSLRPLQHRLHGNPICSADLACRDRPHDVVGLGRRARRHARVEPVFRSCNPRLRARPLAARLDHAVGTGRGTADQP